MVWSSTQLSVSSVFVRHVNAHLLLAAGHAEQRVLNQLALAKAADLIRGLAAAVARRPLRSLREMQSVTSNTPVKLYFSGGVPPWRCRGRRAARPPPACS